MRLHILSDLHLEFAPFSPPNVNCDAVILAGDTCPGLKGFLWALETFPNHEVIYVLGNHEYYGHEYPRLTEKLKSLAVGTNIHVLENDVLHLGGVIFLGCTLWTDFKLLGDPRVAGFFAAEGMNDYRKIRISPSYHRLRPLDTAGIHFRSVDWLSSELEEQRRTNIVVVTHHAPSSRSLPADYQTDILNSASASQSDDLVEKSRAVVWVHGHLHVHQDYSIGSTRVICNPRGYQGEQVTGFNPGLVIEL